MASPTRARLIRSILSSPGRGIGIVADLQTDDSPRVQFAVTMKEKLSLTLLAERYSVCRLDPQSPTPVWAQSDPAFCAITRTPAELSIVCPERVVPSDVAAYHGWRALVVHGPLNPTLIGVLAGLTTTLASAAVSVFAISTYDTDYLLVRERDAPQAVDALRRANYMVTIDAIEQSSFRA